MSEEQKKISNSLSSSLRFPGNNLEICLEKIKILFEKNNQNSISREAVIADLGFSSSNGAADSIVASLKYYGLLNVSDNRYTVSKDIIDYCLDKELSKSVIKNCLLSVPVNKKIFSLYDIDNLPSDNEVKSALVKTCGYNIKQATTYIETFKKNYTLYKKKNDKGIEIQENVPLPIQEEIYSIDQNSVPVVSATEVIHPSPLSNNTKILVTFPNELKNMDKADLNESRAFLEYIIAKIDRQLNNSGV